MRIASQVICSSLIGVSLGLIALPPFLQAQTREETSLWESVKDSKDAEDYRAYLDKYPDGTYAPLAKRRIALYDARPAVQAPPAKTAAITGEVSQPSKSGASAPVTMTECEGTNNCGTWTFLGTQGNGQWPSGSVGNLTVEHFDENSVTIRRSDSTGPSAGLTAVYTGTRHGDRIGGEVKSSWPGHGDTTGNWYATIGKVAQSPPSLMRVCSPPSTDRCGNWTWHDGRYEGVWPGISKTATITLESFGPDSVVMNRTDYDTGKRFIYRGKISSRGDSIIDGEISGVDDNLLTHFVAYWGAQLEDHPALRGAQPPVGPVRAPIICYTWFFALVCQ